MSDEVRRMAKRVAGVHDAMAKAAGLERARVRCETCQREEVVDGAKCLREGWPLCHGATMSLVRP